MSDLTAKQTILIVDDAPENIDVLKGILSDTYKIKAAIHGEKALKSAFNAPPDLILLDIMMPDMDGYEVCRRLKADSRTRSIPVIFVTAKGEVEDETQGFELGAVDYITKPVSPPVVQARVQTQLALYDQNRVLEQKVTERTAEIQSLNMEIEDTQKEVVFTMGSIGETRSKETGNHVKRVAEYSRIFALHYGLPEEEANLIKMASPMHDIGKVGIPDNILNKPGRLTPEEFEHMKKHAELGYEMLKHSSRPILKAAATLAYEHHEKWNGTGYPQGLKGEETHIYGRITAIADVFDALGSDRCYKKAWNDDKIFTLIREERGEHFDPKLVDIFFDHLDEFLTVRDSYRDVE
ncbi:MAG: HD domain-containing phosphohydrolase [Mariprofundus sp.]